MPTEMLALPRSESPAVLKAASIARATVSPWRPLPLAGSS